MQPTIEVVQANATIVSTGKGKKFFFSYETCVAFESIGGLQIRRENVWSKTTTKHMKAMACSFFTILSDEDFDATVKALS